MLRCTALLVAVVASLMSAALAAPAMAASEGDAPVVRWSVTPADDSGPDGRTVVETILEPGEVADDRFAVRNVSEEEVTFRLTAADGFYTRTGRFDILASDRESVAAGTWMNLPDEVTVGAGETVVVPFSITVPDLAEPGDHAAGITASVLRVQSDEDGTSVGVESRVGFRILVRVAGELTAAASVQNVATDYAMSWNPLRAGVLSVSFDVTNEGNARLRAAGTLAAGGREAPVPGDGEVQQELLPGDTRALAGGVDDVWPLFLVPVTIVLAPSAASVDGVEAEIDPIETVVWVWMIPWPQLIVLLALVLIVTSIVWGRVRTRRRVAALVAQAREEGRRLASAASERS